MEREFEGICLREQMKCRCCGKDVVVMMVRPKRGGPNGWQCEGCGSIDMVNWPVSQRFPKGKHGPMVC